MISETLENELETYDLNSPGIYESLLEERPYDVVKYADCLETLQWAIQFWYHADVAVIEEAIPGARRGTCCYVIVLENYFMGKDGLPSMKTSRVTVSPHEILGMYRYYQKMQQK